MLSKSGAKRFFLFGTFVCSAAFALLTIDTIKKVPEQTKFQDLNESAIRGKHLFDRNNCMGCHTIFGEGAYYAPELTKVYSRRGPDFIKALIRDPQAMYPGQRKMQKYDFSEAEIDDLVAFFKWVGDVDLNGFPPRPDLAPEKSMASGRDASSNSSFVEVKRPTIFDQSCTACHSLAGNGGSVGPALDGIGNRRDRNYLISWLQDPTKIKADSKMPNLHLAEEDILALADFLVEQK